MLADTCTAPTNALIVRSNLGVTATSGNRKQALKIVLQAGVKI
mgnify:CR=1 FL=1